MKRFRMILATVGALAVPAATTSAQEPAVLRTLATFSGDSIQEFGVSPNGKFVLVSTSNALRVYDVAGGKTWDLVRGNTEALTWSPQGDRIAWTQGGAASGLNVWSMPIDAQTGRPRGAAQRITTGRSLGAAFSADGRWIAYASFDSTKKMGISVAPASGGPERVVASRYMWEGGMWSADGKSLFVNGEAKTPAGFGIVKIRISDGARELLPSPPGEDLIATTTDRRYLVTLHLGNGAQVRPGAQATVTDTTGRVVGKVPFAPAAGKVMSLPVVLGDSMLAIGLTSSSAAALEVRPLAGGPAKRLPLVGESNTMPLWSPDGRRIAFFAPSAGRTALGVMNADGTNARIYRDVDVLPDILGALWSPDSRSLAFRRAATMGMSMLDVESGNIRQVTEDPIGGWKWRSDGRAILVRSRRIQGAGIDEIMMSGERRTLLDWPGTPGNPVDWVFVGDTSLFRWKLSDTVAYLQPLGLNPARPIAIMPPGISDGRTAISNDSRRVVKMLARTKNASARSTNQLMVVELTTGSARVIDLPFSWLTGGTVSNLAEFVPGDSAVLLFGTRPNESDVKLFLVPLSGAPPTVFADVGATGDGLLAASVSPDGRSVVYSVRPKAATNSLVLLDLRSVLPKSSRSAKP
jgi:Tol biopolymer transport system component